MPTAFLCDFDGTISPDDVGAAFARRFSYGRDAGLHVQLDQWSRGRLGHRALTEAQLAVVEVDEAEARDFTRGFDADPGFGSFVREVRARGDEVMVVSEGFDFYVREQLERLGLSDVPSAANRLRFADRRVWAEFPFADPSCSGCGNCKAQHVRGYRARGFKTILVGDGYSDRCGARAAHGVYARAGSSLETWCREQAIPYRSFSGFSQVAELVARDAARGSRV